MGQIQRETRLRLRHMHQRVTPINIIVTHGKEKCLCKMTCKQARNTCGFQSAKLIFMELFEQWKELLKLVHCVKVLCHYDFYLR